MENIEKIKLKRKFVRSSCTKLIGNIETFMSNVNTQSETDRLKLSEYLNVLDEKQTDLKLLNEKIEELINEETQFNSEIQKSLEYDESICDSKSAIRTKLKQFKIEPAESDQSVNISTLSNNTFQKSINLPKLNIATFSGDPTKFLEFYNSFESAIDSNESLSTVDKFLYLKSFLSGEAYKTVAGFDLKEENYKSCLTLLKERYGKQDQLISVFVNKLLELEPIKYSSNIKALRNLYDESEVSIRNLYSMGIASDKFGYLLIPILLKQLPHNLVIEFHRKRDPNKIGDINELLNFIKFEIESREAANAVSGLSLKTHDTSRSKFEYTRNKSAGKINYPTSAALNTVVKNACVFCNSHFHSGLECKSLTDEQKRYKLKKEGRCYRCFYKHLQSACKVKIQPCKTCCSLEHNFLFCPQTKTKKTVQNQNLNLKESNQNPGNETVMSSLHYSENSRNYSTMLQTALVQVQHESKKLLARVLYDGASSKSFIRSDLAKALNAKILRKEKLLIYTFSNRNPTETEFQCVNVVIRSRHSPFKSINIEALITDEICGTLLHTNINQHSLENIIPEECELADSFEMKKPIQILLGADQMFLTLIGALTKINKRLFLQTTIFGNTLVGQMPDDHKINSASCMNVYCSSKEKDLTCLWELETFLSNEKLKLPSNYFSAFENNLRFVNNRYEAPLIWKSKYSKNDLNNNLENAKKRFIYLERKFERDESLFKRYNDVMIEQLQQGIIQMCNDKCFSGYIMPHREVYRDSSHTSKSRIVFDASSKQGTNCNSLNDCLLSGENLNPDLLKVILKFREFKIAFCGDIARAFLQIQVSDCDRNYLCFLYYKNCDKSQPVVMYHYNRHCFGVTCSPYVLAATIKAHLKEYKTTYPLAYEMLYNSLYVDDLFYGSSTIQDALKLSVEAVKILKDANMHMRKFDSNSNELKNLWKNSNPPVEINEQ